MIWTVVKNCTTQWDSGPNIMEQWRDNYRSGTVRQTQWRPVGQTYWANGGSGLPGVMLAVMIFLLLLLPISAVGQLYKLNGIVRQ